MDQEAKLGLSVIVTFTGVVQKIGSRGHFCTGRISVQKIGRKEAVVCCQEMAHRLTKGEKILLRYKLSMVL